MIVDLSILKADPQTINQKLGAVARFMRQGMRVCLGDCDANGKPLKTSTSPSVANTSFTVGHTLNIIPDFVIGVSMAATGAQAINFTAAEQKTWTEKTVTIHSAATSNPFLVLIGTLR